MGTPLNRTIMIQAYKLLHLYLIIGGENVPKKNFYVYEWFIIDSFEIFYVGKGTGRRKLELHNRSKYFMNIYNKYNCAVRLHKQSLTNEKLVKKK